MPKVTLNKSTKIKGKGLVLAGVDVEVTEEEKKELDKKGFLGEVKKPSSPSNDKEIQELVKKVAELEKGADEALKTENEALKKEIKELKADKKTGTGFFSK